MNRVHPVQEQAASGQVKEIYAAFKKSLGRIPNIFLNMGNAPAALEAFVKLNECAEKTSLSPQLRSQIALAVAQANNCHYCLSAHSAIAKGMGMQDPMILNARKGEAADAKTTAILHFAKKCVEKRGDLQDQDVQALKTARVTDKEIVEIILIITLNIFTNYFNKIVNTEIDFPLAPKM